jgi:hypothetical protein
MKRQSKEYKASIELELENHKRGLKLLKAAPDQNPMTVMNIIVATENAIGQLNAAYYKKPPPLVLTGDDLEQPVKTTTRKTLETRSITNNK